MYIQHYVDSPPSAVTRACLQLAMSEAPSMTLHHVGTESPMRPLAEAEVAIRLNTRLEMIGSRTEAAVNNMHVELKEGLIIAANEKYLPPLIAGFIQYTPHILTEGVATIGFAAVHLDYQGKGLFTRMLKVLRAAYPTLAVNCPLELAAMYQRLGFTPYDAQGVHLAMGLGTLSGMRWMPDHTDIEKHEAYLKGMSKVRQRMGPLTADAFEKRRKDTALRADQVKNFLAQYLTPAADSD